MNILQAYDRAIVARPILVKSITSAVLFGAGDVLSQKLEARNAKSGETKAYDWARTARMVGWGAGFGVLAHGWYSVVAERIALPGYQGVAAKVFADQLIWTPPLNILFFTYSGMAEHGNFGKAIADAKAKLWPVLKVNWGVWFPVQALNFTVIPPQYRVLFVNAIALFWSAYLSTMAAADAPIEDAKAEDTSSRA